MEHNANARVGIRNCPKILFWYIKRVLLLVASLLVLLTLAIIRSV